MGELEDKISALLSSPDGLEKVLSVARSLSGPDGALPELNSNMSFDSKATESENTAIPNLNALSSLAGLGDINPKTLSFIMRIIKEYSAKDDRKTALLNSLKPYIKTERQEKIDRAVQIAKLARVAKTAISGLGGDIDV